MARNKPYLENLDSRDSDEPILDRQIKYMQGYLS